MFAQARSEGREGRMGSGIHFRLALTSLVAANAHTRTRKSWQLPAGVTQQSALRCAVLAHIAHTQRATARTSITSTHSCAQESSQCEYEYEYVWFIIKSDLKIFKLETINQFVLPINVTKYGRGKSRKKKKKQIYVNDKWFFFWVLWFFFKFSLNQINSIKLSFERHA